MLSSLKAKELNNRSGQAFIEYILFLVIVAAVVMGVLRPIMTRKMNEIQETLRARASAVISQTQLGIPHSWFFANSGGDFNGIGKRISDAQNAADSVGGGGGGEGPSDSGGPASGPGKKNGPSGGGPGSSSGPNTSTGNSPNISSNRGSNSSSSSSDESETESEEPQSSDRRDPKRSGGGGGNQGFGADGEEAEKEKESTDLSVTGEEAGEEGDSGSGKKMKAQENAKKEIRGRQGCGDVNIFTILKIAAILIIIFIAAAVAISGRGNKGSD